MTNIINPILIDIPMPIRTPRLVLRTPQAGDGAIVHDAKVESQGDLEKWMPWAKGDIGTVEQTEIVVRENFAKFILRQDMMLLAFNHTGRFIGSTGLHRFDWEFRSFEIGYWIRSTEHRKGYASEIANALTRFAFGALNARRVMIAAATANTASRKVIEKNGYELESLMKADHFLPDGSVTGTAQYVRYNIDGLAPLDVMWG